MNSHRESEAGRWALLVEYDGSGFSGWQRQINGSSIQQVLEESLGAVLGREVRVHAAGRTDAGVHAVGQVAAFDAPRPAEARELIHGANAYLPSLVRVRDALPVVETFDPRRDALRRHYVYRLAHGGVAPALGRTQCAWMPASAMDWGRVEEALDVVRGRHEFAAFRSSKCTAVRTVLDLVRAEVNLHPRGDRPSHGVLAEFHWECRSFLHHMVRFLTGAVLEVGRGKLSLDTLRLMLESGLREGVRLFLAPAEGLCLVSVTYSPELGLWVENAVTDVACGQASLEKDPKSPLL